MNRLKNSVKISDGGAVSETYTHTSPSMSKEPELQAGGGIASTAGIPVPVARPTIQGMEFQGNFPATLGGSVNAKLTSPSFL